MKISEFIFCIEEGREGEMDSVRLQTVVSLLFMYVDTNN
jgi:hypothetical protein